MKNSIHSTKEAVEYVIDRLLPVGCLLHRYNAHSSKSIYLKVDAGIACSVRFSDHKGYDHLKYRFNYMAQEPGNGVEQVGEGGFYRSYYQSEAIDQLVSDILSLRTERRQQYPNYNALMETHIEQGREHRGFWQHAYCVNDYLEKKRAQAGGGHA